jgi:glycine cleavage system H lipoate-binding protein
VDQVISAYLAHLAEGCEIHLDRPYTSGHLWMQEASPGEVLLGLDSQDLKILFPIQDIFLPRPGVRLERGQAMGWVIRGTLALPLLSPLRGEVLEVNEELPAELRGPRFPKAGDRWLIRLEAHGSLDELPGLLRMEAVLGWHAERLGVIRQFLRKAMDPGVGAGATLNDGGVPNPNLEEVLGTAAFRELLDRLFPRPE